MLKLCNRFALGCLAGAGRDGLRRGLPAAFCAVPGASSLSPPLLRDSGESESVRKNTRRAGRCVRPESERGRGRRRDMEGVSRGLARQVRMYHKIGETVSNICATNSCLTFGRHGLRIGMSAAGGDLATGRLGDLGQVGVSSSREVDIRGASRAAASRRRGPDWNGRGAWRRGRWRLACRVNCGLVGRRPPTRTLFS